MGKSNPEARESVPAAPESLGEIARHVGQLRSGDYRARLQAVRALAALRDTRLVPTFGRALDDTSLQVRAVAAQALGELADPEGVPWLLCALADREPRVRETAAAALARAWDLADAKPLLVAFRLKPRRARAIVRALAHRGTTEPLARLLGERDSKARNRGVVGLALADRLHGTAKLPAVLAPQSAAVRASAASALGLAGGAEAVAPLRHLLQDVDPLVRHRAADALGGLGAVAGVALVELREAGKHDGWFFVRWSSRRAARRIEAALREAPAEPEAASAPEGTGMELESGVNPAGTGTELVADDFLDDEERPARPRPWWMFWRR